MTSRTAERLLAEASGNRQPVGTWTSRAFGLAVEGDFPTKIFDPIEDPGDRHVRLMIVPRRALAEHWNEAHAERQLEGRRPTGRLVLTISADPARGYHVWGEGHGDYVISPDGTRITCIPGRLASWRWQRFLIGQLLPLASSLHGLEIFHASAVAIGDRAIGFVGDSGAGKTSVAVNLLLRGASFVADDVIALERRHDELLAHPGTALIGIKPGQPDLVAALSRGRIASVIRTDREETLCKVGSTASPIRLGRLYFIDRRGYRGSLRFEPVEDVRLLMTATFSIIQRDPVRLERLLDVAARIATGGGAYWIRVPEGMSAMELARSVESHLSRSPELAYGETSRRP